MAIFNHVKLMLSDDSARSLLGAKAEERHEFVVKRDSDRHVFDSNLNVVDYRFHRVSEPSRSRNAGLACRLTPGLSGGAGDTTPGAAARTMEEA
jgi:hypothetical protein